MEIWYGNDFRLVRAVIQHKSSFQSNNQLKIQLKTNLTFIIDTPLTATARALMGGWNIKFLNLNCLFHKGKFSL